MAEETSYYSDQNGVRVTDKRVIIGSTTYSMANITSVSTKVEHPSKIGPILIIAIGVLFVLTSLASKSLGGVLVAGVFVALGYFWFRGIKPIWHLRIASASAEHTPIQSINQQWIAPFLALYAICMAGLVCISLAGRATLTDECRRRNR